MHFVDAEQAERAEIMVRWLKYGMENNSERE